MRRLRFAAASVVAMSFAGLIMVPSQAGAARGVAATSNNKAAEARAAIAKLHIGPNMRASSPSSKIRGTVTQASSYNWSGYADVQPSSGTNVYKSVKASWVQPTLTCTSEDRVVVFWVGLDGWTNNAVEQDGVYAQCFQGSAFYGTWWEMYPTNSIQLVGTTVHPGDSIKASVLFTGSAHYTLAVTDVTTPANSFTQKATCASGVACTNSSAEWIGERPSNFLGVYPLAQFSPWTVTGALVATTTTSGTVTTFPAFQIAMIDATATYNLAQPSAFVPATKKFTDTWLNSY